MSPSCPALIPLRSWPSAAQRAVAGWRRRAAPVAVAAVEREPTVADVTGGRGRAFVYMFRDALLQDAFFWFRRGTPTAAPPVVALAGKSIRRAAFGDKVLSGAVMRPTAEAAKVATSGGDGNGSGSGSGKSRGIGAAGTASAGTLTIFLDEMD